jgi:hypothetical protein
MNRPQGRREKCLAYANQAYGDSEVNLEVDVQGGAGEINLEVV